MPRYRVPHAPAIRDLLAAGAESFSFEFMPPKSEEDERKLWLAIRQLEPLAPTFVSVTYGAGGSTRDRTVRVTGRIAAETTLTPLGHLTAVSHSVAELRHVIGSYADFAITQMFFYPDDYLRLRDAVTARGCDVPIIPGIMPIISVSGIERAVLLSGCRFPPDLADDLRAHAEDKSA